VGNPAAGGSPGCLAYGLGRLCAAEGDIEEAVRWFRRAAQTGCPEAALPLGELLGRLADEHRAERRDSAELLLAEATRWLCEARSSAVPDAIERVTDMLNRHQRLAARRGLKPA
jgi:TPR repeat protein